MERSSLPPSLILKPCLKSRFFVVLVVFVVRVLVAALLQYFYPRFHNSSRSNLFCGPFHNCFFFASSAAHTILRCLSPVSYLSYGNAAQAAVTAAIRRRIWPTAK